MLKRFWLDEVGCGSVPRGSITVISAIGRFGGDARQLPPRSKGPRGKNVGVVRSNSSKRVRSCQPQTWPTSSPPRRRSFTGRLKSPRPTRSPTPPGPVITGNGAGQTIAIVDAYNDPTIAGDLATFDNTFGLAPPPGLTVVNQLGKSPPLTTDSGWAIETSLDVEWAHAMAPSANILLVEANSASLANLLTAVSTAAHGNVNNSPVTVVSMSWGSGEFLGETSYDSTFNVPGVTFVAASGDSGAPGLWPAFSPNVLAVGGTTLTVNSTSGAWVSETAWSGSGGGVSRYEALPSYQKSFGIVASGRVTPDVSFDANPSTGYYVYDSVPYQGYTGWWDVGGTSAVRRNGPPSSPSPTKAAWPRVPASAR